MRNQMAGAATATAHQRHRLPLDAALLGRTPLSHRSSTGLTNSRKPPTSKDAVDGLPPKGDGDSCTVSSSAANNACMFSATSDAGMKVAVPEIFHQLILQCGPLSICQPTGILADKEYDSPGLITGFPQSTQTLNPLPLNPTTKKYDGLVGSFVVIEKYDGLIGSSVVIEKRPELRGALRGGREPAPEPADAPPAVAPAAPAVGACAARSRS